MAEFDYRQLYKEEPIRFRGMQGCGTTNVEPMPKRPPRKPAHYQGLGQKLKHCDEPDEHFDAGELERGTEVELEHSDDRTTARCIAKAHLLESPLYYQELEKMERRLKRKTPKFVWKRTDSGCLVGSAAQDKSHPCDVVYENVNTGQRMQFATTAKAHMKLPAKVKSIESLKKRAGFRWDKELL